jgi:outer membrane protein assembly factor BamB
MTLRGLLRSFPPLEVLQFLTQSGKTGILRVYDETDTKLLAFEHGQLLYAIHQRKLPLLAELLIHREVLSEENSAKLPVSDMRWDDVVTRALERHRSQLRKQKLDRGGARQMANRLGSVLVAQGRLSEAQLKAATDPEMIPDKCLKAVLKGADVIHALDSLDSVTGGAEGKSLYSAIIEKKILTREEIGDAVAMMPDESLADILVYRGALSRAEARLILDQLQSLRKCVFPSIRLGEYMVAKGQISQRQLERALSEQFASSDLLGAIVVEQGAISEEELEKTNREIETLRSDFGPLYPLRCMLERRHRLDHEDFALALRKHRQSDRSLIEALADTGKLSVERVRKVVETVVIRELCDLLIWSDASFEFYEGFSLSHVLPEDDVPVHQNGAFDLQSMLLVACRDLDELLSRGVSKISSDHVYIPSVRAADDDSGEPAEPRRQDRIIKRLDGRRNLAQACRVLPGNRLSHFLLFADLQQAGEIGLLSRENAFDRGSEAYATSEYEQALVLFQHALHSPGSDPTNYVLRGAIQDARLGSEKRVLWRAVLRLKKLLPPYGEGLLGQRVAQWLNGSGRVGSWIRSAWASTKESVSHFLAKSRLSIEAFFMRQGWTRDIWRLKERILRPFEKLLGSGGARAAVVLGISVAGLLVAITSALPDDTPAPSSDLPLLLARPVQLRSSMASYRVAAPLEMAPTVQGRRVYLSARDGMFRALDLSMGSPEDPGKPTLDLQWEVKLGEYGDILSRPILVRGNIYVTSVRGQAFCISSLGEIQWRQTLPRLEGMEPTPLYTQEGELVGVAVVSRESVYVLDPAQGNVLYRLPTGNRIFARPVGNEAYLIVGSGDSHVYMVRWREGVLVWDHEVTDDITSLIVQEDIPVFATRDGRLAALDPVNGQELWRRTFSRNAIKSLTSLGSGELSIETGRGTIEVIRLRTGETSSIFSADPTLGVSVATMWEGQYYYVSESGFMGELDESGHPWWRTKRPVGDITGWDHGKDFLAVTNRRGELMIFFRKSRALDGH